MNQSEINYLGQILKIRLLELKTLLDSHVSPIFIQLLMHSQQESQQLPASRSTVPVLLIYYNFRGIGQMIRYLLCYCNIPYIDILLDEYEQQKETLPIEVLQVLKSKCINRNDLPGIIHNNQVIYQLNQVMNYICITFQRQDLLGVDIFQKARVCEVQQRYSVHLTQNIRFLSGFVAEVHKTKLEGQDLLSFVEEKLQLFFNESGYFKELSMYLLIQDHQQFVLKNATIIDFYFIESSKFAVGLFSSIDEQLTKGQWNQIARNFRIHKQRKGKKIRNVENLRAMKNYLQFIVNQPFYIQNRKYLEGFKMFPKAITGQQSLGMKKLQTSYFLDLYYNGTQ